MNNNNEFQLIKDIIITNNVTLDNIKELVNNTIEKTTGITLYNKDNMLKELESIDVKDVEQVANIIVKNMIMQIKFDTVFKSDFGFSLIFDNIKPIVIHKNKRVALTDLEDIRKDMLESNFILMPKNNKLFVDTLFIIIEKIINMDYSVTYYCTDWPQPWLSLFEKICYKNDKDMKLKLTAYTYIDNIISGTFYKKIEKDIYIIKEDTYIIKDELSENKEDNDTTYRMEVMAYLNDDEVIYFLETLENYDKMIATTINETKTISKLLEFTANTNNKIIQFYFINKLFRFIMTIKEFLLKHTNFAIQVNKKIDEITDDLYIIQSAGLNLSIELTNTLIEAKEFMHTLKN